MKINYQQSLNSTGEFGVVEKINYPIVEVDGLPKARLKEIVVFENNHIGEIFSIKPAGVKILLYSSNQVDVGLKCARTKEILKLGVGQNLLGSLINPLGQPLSFETRTEFKPTSFKEIRGPIPTLNQRAHIDQPLSTGTAIVDMMIPLGHGQRELIIGDKKTGKSSFLFSASKFQAEKGTIIIYVAIGKKRSYLKKLLQFIQKEKVNSQFIIIASNPTDSPGLIYLTPETGITIAEYFCQSGNNVLLILDDLSTHAKFYREISLIAERLPGRESYPGDIFHLHARIIERAGNFKNNQNKKTSISCFPVVETTNSDLTGYIPTNIIGMTDGHIFFDTNLFNKGQRPSINAPLSVTRVGHQAHSRLWQEITRLLTAFIVRYEKVQKFSYFGAELSAKVKNTLQKGKQLYELFDQNYIQSISEEIQIILFTLIWTDFFANKKDGQIEQLKQRLVQEYKNSDQRKFFQQLIVADTFYDLTTNVNKHKDKFVEMMNG